MYSGVGPSSRSSMAKRLSQGPRCALFDVLLSSAHSGSKSKTKKKKKKEEEKRTVTSSSAGKTGVENQAKELRL
jgi:hypothetical protein